MVRILVAAVLALAITASHAVYDGAAADDGAQPATGDSSTTMADAPAPAPSDADGAPTAMELALFTLTNDDRARAGLSQLSFDFDLLSVARDRGSDQTAQSSLSHYDATGQLAFVKALNGHQANYVRAGENLARVPQPLASAADRAEQALMQSPSHRANILQPEYDRLAIGEVTDASGRIVFAEIFRATP